MSALLEARNVTYSFDNERTVLNNISLKVGRGQAIGITGPSGCGKSTLCHVLTGIIPHIYGGFLDGDVCVCGKNTVSTPQHLLAQNIGMVFQSPDTQLFSSAVEHDIAFGPENLCLEWAEINDRINNALLLTGMADKRSRNPKSLSGGEAQLAAIATVLSMNPDIIILDEAMSALDEKGVSLVQHVVYKLKQFNKGLIIVDHDLERLAHADKIYILDQGRLTETR